MFNKKSRIYVAGHTGLLGTALLKKLGDKGYDNIITRTRAELELTNSHDVDEFFRNEQPDYVFMAAGLTGGIMANKTYPATFLHTNLAMQNNIFDSAHKYDVKKIVFYGSSCIYPKNAPQPMKEKYFMSGSIEETSEAYAVAKIAGVVACKAYNNQYKTNRFIALVPNSMYGPNDNFDLENSHVLSALIRKFHEAKRARKNKVVLWGSGNPRREFIFSEDVAGASIFAMENADRLQNSHYNVGTGIDYSINELAGIISKIIGFEGSVEWDTSKPDGAAKKLLDSSKFSRLGWKPRTSLEKGLRKTVNWFLKQKTGGSL